MKRSTTKRALWLSVVSMFLCLTMFMGTTFAWFTDEATSGTNTIVAGNLDVELYHADKATAGADVKVEKDTKLFDDVDSTKWEPGAVAWEKLTVANEGNLALKYKLTLNVENATVVNGVSFASKLKVAVVDESFVYSRENVANLPAEKWDDLASFTLPGTILADADLTDGVPATAVHGIIIWWEPSANDNLFNMNNDKAEGSVKVDVGVHLFATQVENEKDSFDEKYDSAAPAVKWDGVTVTTPVADANGVYHVTNGAELAGINNLLANLNAEEKINVVLDTDIDLGNYPWTPVGTGTNWGEVFSGTFDGNNHTIYNVNVGGAVSYALRSTPADNAGFFGVTTNNSVIKNLTLENVAVKGGERVGALVGMAQSSSILNCNVINASVSGASKVGALAGDLVSSKAYGCAVTEVTVAGDERVAGLFGRMRNDGVASTAINNKVNHATIVLPAGTTVTEQEVALVGQNVTGADLTSNSYSNITLIGGEMVAPGVVKNDTKSFQITSKDGFLALSSTVSGISSTYEEPITIDLLCDIDMKDVEWTPIDKMFVHLDGNGHTISNLTVDGEDDWAGRSGLFPYLGGGSISNLTLENVTSSGSQVGTFAGHSEGGDIINCTLKGKIVLTWTEDTVDGIGNGIGAFVGVSASYGTANEISGTVAEGTEIVMNSDGMTLTDKSYGLGVYHGSWCKVGDSDVAPVINVVNNGKELTRGGIEYAYEDGGASVKLAAAGNTTTARGIVEENAGITSAVVAEGIEVLGNRTFRRCYGLETVTLPSTLTEIESGAFQACSSLKSITIPATVTAIGDQAFYGCTSLESINIPTGVERIEASAIRDTAITEIEIPETVTYIGSYAFRECRKLTSVTILAENFTMEKNAFYIVSGTEPATVINVKNEAMKTYVEGLFSGDASLDHITVVVMP